MWNLSIKFLKKNIGEKPLWYWVGKDFLYKTPKAWSIKKKKDKFEFVKIKSFWSLKDTVKRMKSHATDEENLFIIIYLIKDMYPE